MCESATQKPVLARLDECCAIQISALLVVVGRIEYEEDGILRLELVGIDHPTSLDRLPIISRPTHNPLLRKR